MRNAIVAILVTGITAMHSACTPPAPPVSPLRQNCEALLEAMLKSPSSLEIVEVEEGQWRGDTKDIEIVYDADNSFGASLRGTLTCSYLSDPDWWTDTKGIVDMRTDTTPVPAYRLIPYELVSDGQTIGGDKTEPALPILMHTTNLSDILRRREAERE